jgi:hypothetical protein
LSSRRASSTITLEIKKESTLIGKLLNDLPELTRERNCLHIEGSFFIPPTDVDWEPPETVVSRVDLLTIYGDRCTEDSPTKASLFLGHSLGFSARITREATRCGVRFYPLNSWKSPEGSSQHKTADDKERFTTCSFPSAAQESANKL